MAPQKVVPLRLETYLAVLKNSVGTRMFRTFHAEVNGKKKDIMRKGDLSCAFFVSFVCAGLGLIKQVHGTVGGTVEDLKKSGWKKTRVAKPGCVVVWAAKVDERGELHRHIGFYIGSDRAISNDSKKGFPRTHAYNIRPIEALYANPKMR